MQLGETIATYDLGLALRGESGKFEVTSPDGEIYHVICKPVICKPDQSISNLEWTGNRTSPQPFLIRKITETVALEPGKETAEVGKESRNLGGAPFLLESQDEVESSSAAAAVVMLPKVADGNPPAPEATHFELMCAESEAGTRQPAVWIAVKSERGNGATGNEMLMTARCTSFNEFDAEIRKLHAQLDNIRSHARKKFYNAYAATA